MGNDAAVLPGTEKYMSGTTLYPFKVSLAARLAAERLRAAADYACRRG